jgi:hypothetical protein
MDYFIKRNDEQFALQLGNFSSKIGDYAALFNLTPEEVVQAEKDAAFFNWVVNNLPKVETYKQNWFNFKRIARVGEGNVVENTVPNPPVFESMPGLVPPNIQSRFAMLAKRIKAHQNYTTAIGENLGIEGSEQQRAATEDVQPLLKATMSGGKVIIEWKKYNYEGIVIEKDTGNGFTVLDKDIHPNFTDNSALPPQGQSALWRYRAMYFLKDERIGDWSDIVSIAVTG